MTNLTKYYEALTEWTTKEPYRTFSFRTVHSEPVISVVLDSRMFLNKLFREQDNLLPVDTIPPILYDTSIIHFFVQITPRIGRGRRIRSMQQRLNHNRHRMVRTMMLQCQRKRRPPIPLIRHFINVQPHFSNQILHNMNVSGAHRFVKGSPAIGVGHMENIGKSSIDSFAKRIQVSPFCCSVIVAFA
mmetsp:Transcript_36851/g.64579  ORF Transcript_36851/g.64579 Transcript_36851/m.64579 type:complete len:187 (-) Transcript_36851:80-640(-)